MVGQGPLGCSIAQRRKPVSAAVIRLRVCSCNGSLVGGGSGGGTASGVVAGGGVGVAVGGGSVGVGSSDLGCPRPNARAALPPRTTTTRAVPKTSFLDLRSGAEPIAGVDGRAIDGALAWSADGV